MRLVPGGGKTVLDVGARDGHFSKLLADKYERVTSLDLEKPAIYHEKIQCVQGDVTHLEFGDNSYDLVFCVEVLEHIPSHLLARACSELSRVCRQYLIIGVPYKQDIRVGRTTCYTCGAHNPPWGHINCFDEQRLQHLFPQLKVSTLSFVGHNESRTNTVSALLMDCAGNPYGTYSQEEPCIYCQKRLVAPPGGFSLVQKIFAKLAFYVNNIQKPFLRVHGDWIHILFQKPTYKKSH
jgi:SAM-dependent methyltransferase